MVFNFEKLTPQRTNVDTNITGYKIIFWFTLGSEMECLIFMSSVVTCLL